MLHFLKVTWSQLAPNQASIRFTQNSSSVAWIFFILKSPRIPTIVFGTKGVVSTDWVKEVARYTDHRMDYTTTLTYLQPDGLRLEPEEDSRCWSPSWSQPSKVQSTTSRRWPSRRNDGSNHHNGFARANLSNLHRHKLIARLWYSLNNQKPWDPNNHCSNGVYQRTFVF